MAKQKIYAVKSGRVPGLYNTWDECKAQVNGYSGAEYKSFANYDDAVSYIKGSAQSGTYYENASGQFSFLSKSSSKSEPKQIEKSKNQNTEIKTASISQNIEKPCFKIYTDGSYDPEQKKYSYGFVVVDSEKMDIKKFSGVGQDPIMLPMRNVAGEILGAVSAMKYCLDHDIKKVEINYDYEGIANWPLGTWTANKEGTQRYVRFYNAIKNQIDISFRHVIGHSGNAYNEMADKLAREALGL